MKKIIIAAMLSLAVMTALVNCTKKAEEPAAAAVTEETAVELNWLTNLEEGIEKAKNENKTVFVNFTGSDWCGWCIKLKAEVFSKKEFIDYANSSLVMVELDFPQRIEQTQEVKDYNRKTLEKFGVRGFPTILLINGEGKEIGRTGYQQGGPLAYIEHLKSFINK